MFSVRYIAVNAVVNPRRFSGLLCSRVFKNRLGPKGKLRETRTNHSSIAKTNLPSRWSMSTGDSNQRRRSEHIRSGEHRIAPKIRHVMKKSFAGHGPAPRQHPSPGFADVGRGRALPRSSSCAVSEVPCLTQGGAVPWTAADARVGPCFECACRAGPRDPARTRASALPPSLYELQKHDTWALLVIATFVLRRCS